MAGIPLKSGADFYNLEASRMRLHNLGADPTEFGLGQIYYNSSSGNNTSGRARLYTGTGFRSLAFMEDVDAINEKLDLFFGDDLDADGIISSWKEVQDFLDQIPDTKDLMDMLNGKLDKTGGTINGTVAEPLQIKSSNASCYINFQGSRAYMGYSSSGSAFIQFGSSSTLAVKADGAYYNSNKILTSAGGTITGALTISSPSWGEQLIINRTTANTAPSIKFQNNGTTLGFLGMRTNEKLYYAPSTGGDGYDILTSAGGTLTGSTGNILVINRTSGNPIITFQSNGTVVGRLGINVNGYPIFGTAEGGAHALLHAGNVGEYALKTDGSNEMKDVLFLNFSNPRIAFKSGDKTHGSFGYFSDGLKWYSSAENAYHTIAFTDSNVASATKLETPRTIWGQSFDGTGNVSGDLNLGSSKIFWKNSSTAYYIGCSYSLTDDTPNLDYNGFAGHRFMTKSGSVSMLINSSGNVTIGGSDLAGTDAKLYVDGAIKGKDGLTLICSTKTAMGAYIYMGEKHLTIESAELNVGYNVPLVLNPKNGNVLIGTTTDSGVAKEKLQVAGYAKAQAFVTNGDYGVWKGDVFGGTGNTASTLVIHGEKIQARGNTEIIGDLHVKGNIIADKEVSAGGAAEESGEGGGGTGGGVEPFYKTFTPSTTTVTINHNISSRNVIVQVYEQDSQITDVWHAVLVDIEIVNETTVNLHFGRTETTEHKVVIIG